MARLEPSTAHSIEISLTSLRRAMMMGLGFRDSSVLPSVAFSGFSSLIDGPYRAFRMTK